MLGSKKQKFPCPKKIYENTEKYRDDHIIKNLRKTRTSQEWCQTIKDWQTKLEAAKCEIADNKLNPEIDQEDARKYSQFISVHMFAMKHLTKVIEQSDEEPPRNSKLRQDLLARLWTRAYAVDQSYVPLGRCSLTAVLDLEDAMQSSDFQKKEWSNGSGAPGKPQGDVMHGWHGVRNALLAG